MRKMIEFKVGQVLNFSWDSLPGKLIKFYNLKKYGKSNDNKWTHSAIVAEINSDDVIVYEAINQGFTERVYNKYELNTYIKEGYMTVGTPIEKLINVRKNCEKYLGAPYGWYDIFSIALYSLFGKKVFKINTNAKHLICSEAVARILYDSSNKKIDFEKEFGIKYDLIAPIDLYKSKQIVWLK